MRTLHAALITIIVGLLAAMMSGAANAEPTPTPVDAAPLSITEDTPELQPVVEIPQPTPDTPSEVELVPAIDPGVAGTEPVGKAKQLADAIVTRLHAKHPDYNIRAVVLPQKHKTRVRLTVQYPGAEPVLMSFVSNCSVNSQFNVSPGSSFSNLADPDSTAPKQDLADHIVTLVCADWTCLNHSWDAAEATVPTKYRVSIHDKRLDISYDESQVKAYNRTVVTRMKSKYSRLAIR